MASPTTVLLGAGASIDAGLQSSTGLTRELVRLITDRTAGSTDQSNKIALNFALGALTAKITSEGGNFYAGIDVETLFSAVDALAHRRESELSPFVASWVDGLAKFQTAPPSVDWAKAFSNKSLDASASSYPIEVSELFTQAVVEITTTDFAARAFSNLSTYMVGNLEFLLQVDPSSVDYLAPLLNSECQGATQIATLNYDRTIEELGARAGVQVDTGARRWREGADWAWEQDASVRLLKLHGSVDWRLEKRD